MSRVDRRNLEWNLVMFMATEAGKAIDEVLIGPRQTMDWFKSIVREYNKDKQVMTWVTPVGFPVIQDYRKFETKSLDTNFDGIRIQTKHVHPTNKLDGSKCSSGFAPNIIHSYDSAHLMMTINRLSDMGIKDFGVVHDSFATHLGHVQELSDQLRLTFIEMYRGNVAESMWQEFQEGLGKALPKPIEPGHLDITRIMESDYFFN
jgi:DNA-directed RNA polymerase